MVRCFAVVRSIHQTFGKFRQIFPFNEIIRFQEDFSKARLPDRIVLEVELVESMEGVLVGMHIERIDGQLVCSQI